MVTSSRGGRECFETFVPSYQLPSGTSLLQTHLPCLHFKKKKKKRKKKSIYILNSTTNTFNIEEKKIKIELKVHEADVTASAMFSSEQ